MAKISEMTAAAALNGAEQVEVVQTAATRRATTQAIADLVLPAGSEDDLVALDATGDLKTVDSGAYALAADLTKIAANTRTASYTLVADDAGKAIEMDVAGANDLTVPPNSSVAFPTGTVVEVCQVGAGQTTIVAGSGVTINTPETLILSGQWSTVSLRKRGTDLWVLAGDVEASA